MHSSAIKKQILQWYAEYHKPEYLTIDPLLCVRALKTHKDREIGALVAAVLAYGKVETIISHCQWLFSTMSWKPYDFIISTNFRNKRTALKGFKHRFNDATDVAQLLESIAVILKKYSTLEDFFRIGYKNGDCSVKNALCSFSQNIKSVAFRISKKESKSFNYLFPSPNDGSACKRLNMFLRWVVRNDDMIDLGLWRSISPSMLIIPVDTHIARLAQLLGITSKKSVNWKMAEEITAVLRTIDKSDPIKFDFSICRAGMTLQRRSNSELGTGSFIKGIN